MTETWITRSEIEKAGLNLPIAAEGSIERFRIAFLEKTAAQNRFLVVGLSLREGKLFPVGVLVDSIAKDGIYFGKKLPNGVIEEPQERISIPKEAIVDCSYVELWELQEGTMWKSLFLRKDKGVRSELWDLHCREFLTVSPTGRQVAVSPPEFEFRKLLIESLNGNLTTIDKLSRMDPLLRIPISYQPAPWRIKSCVIAIQVALQDFIVCFAPDEIVSPLIERRWLVEDKRHSPIHNAAARNRPVIIQHLFDAGFSVDFVDFVSHTPLISATNSNSKEALGLLLKLGAKPNARDNGGRTALHKVYDLELLEMLVAASGDLEAQDDEGRSVLSYAMEEGLTEIALKVASLTGQSDKVAGMKLVCPEEVGKEVVRKQTSLENLEFLDRLDFGVVLPFRYIDMETLKIVP